MTSDWHHFATHIVVNCPEYRWELEEQRGPEGQQMLFAHVRVHKLAPSLIKEMRKTYALFRQCVDAPMFATGELDDDKFARFLANFDFKYLQNVVCENGETRRLFVSLPRGAVPAPKEEQQNVGSVLPRQNPERLRQHDAEPVGPAGSLPHPRL